MGGSRFGQGGRFLGSEVGGSPRFGEREGACISNKATVLREVDASLGLDRPPDLEVLLTDHLTSIETPMATALHTTLLRFGHVAIRYTTSDGVERVMNILGGVEGADMVHFVAPEEYIYGTSGWETYAQQGGAYNRDFVGVRVERCAAGSIDAMHAFYEALRARSRIGGVGGARFQLVEARLSRFSDHLPRAVADAVRFGLRKTRRAGEILENADALADARRASRSLANMSRDVRAARWTSGNCAQWTSSGIHFAGLLRRTRLFPKAILVELLESEVLSHERPDNVHVVVYSHVAHAPPYLPEYRFLKSAYTHPLSPVRNLIYGDMHEFADVVVRVPDGGHEARVTRNPAPRRPPRWIPYWRGLVLGVPALVLVGAVDHVGPIGPATAALWLGLNWWLH